MMSKAYPDLFSLFALSDLGFPHFLPRCYLEIPAFLHVQGRWGKFRKKFCPNSFGAYRDAS